MAVVSVVRVSLAFALCSAVLSLSACSQSATPAHKGDSATETTQAAPQTQVASVAKSAPQPQAPPAAGKPAAKPEVVNKPAEQPKLTEAEAIAKMAKFNGRPNFDKEGPDKSVVGFWYKGNPVTDDGLAYLGSFPKLTSLQVYHQNHVTDKGLVHIAGLTNLDRLRLDGVRASDAGLVHLRGLKKLKTLEIIGTDITGPGLENIKELTSLESLVLSFNAELTDAGLVHLTGLKNLKSLSLDDTKVTKAGVDQLKKALPHCRIQTSLDNIAVIDPTKSSASRASEAQSQSETPDPSHAGDWPQWRGPNRDGHSHEKGLLQEWSGDGPPLRWEVPIVHNGHSSFVVERGRLFTMGAVKNQAFLYAIDANTGAKLWELPIAADTVVYSAPTSDGDFVYALGYEGDLVCAESSSGKEVWRVNFKKDFGGDFMSRGMGGGYSESVLIDGDKLICTPGAKDAMVVCLNKKTGKTIWKAAYPADVGTQGVDLAGFASPVISNACGIRQYVQLAGRGLISVAADDGRTLWAYNKIAAIHACISTPVVSGDYVFASTAEAGSGTSGTALIKVVPHQGGVKAEEVYRLPNRVAGNHHGGMVLVGDYIYMSHGYNRGFPMCLEMKTGKIAWRPGRGPGTGSAAVLYADGHIYFRYENDVMALVEATPEKFVLKGQFKVGKSESGEWSHPIIAGGCLYVRSQGWLRCYDLKKT